MSDRSLTDSRFRLTDVWRGRSLVSDRLYHGDNLAVVAALLPHYASKIALVYLDPPFLARRVFRREIEVNGRRVDADAYSDVWSGGLPRYLRALRERLGLVRELLAPEGSLFVHVNWRVAPYVQVLLDEIFGAGEREGPGRPGFRNEIVWGFGGGGNVRNAYRRKHDNLFWYTKSRKWCFRPQFRPYTSGTKQRGLTAVKGPRYELRDEGASLETWWTDPGVQKILSPTAFENLKYPTQKPESLLERIIEGHSEPGDLVADFYCGSGTTPAVAARLGRRWLACDSSRLAVAVTWQRLVAVHQALRQEGDATPGVALYRQADFSKLTSGATAKATYGSRDGSATVTLHDHRSAEAPDAGLAAVDYWAADFGSVDGCEKGVDWAADVGPWTFAHDAFSRRYGSRLRELSLELSAHLDTKAVPKVKVVDCFGGETLAETCLE